MNFIFSIAVCLLLSLGLLPQAVASSYTSPADQCCDTQVFWGDTHLHTRLSLDAFSGGNRLGADTAYRFARGEPVKASNGMIARLRRPLDFLVVADHSENMGLLFSLDVNDVRLTDTPAGQKWLSLWNTDKARAAKTAWSTRLKGDEAFRQAMWNDVIDAAETYNDPGRFTAFIGYEWSEAYYNLHRVVIFKDGAEKARTVLPFSNLDSSDPEALWDYFDNYEQSVNGRVLAIPHNSNLTMGMMFALQTYQGTPLSTAYALLRSRWEPLLEVTQIKGDSETHPLLSPKDEFADFETWSRTEPTLSEQQMAEYRGYPGWLRRLEGASEKVIRTYEYARSGLKLGLSQQAAIGANPFKFGMVGGTDAHTSLPAIAEDNFWGKFPSENPSPDRIRTLSQVKRFNNVSWPVAMNAAGYTAVWATENTRESIFAAMKRKEVYASTGPRIRVRFFGGWDYQANDAYRPNLAAIGYRQGVPMGGDLTQAPQGKSPTFLVQAVKDLGGANLDRIQIIKGWRSENGELHEKVYNIALSDNRVERKGGTVNPVGNTVDISRANYTNTIGDPELTAVWRDPDFNPQELAFYYLRVLEIPTPRWTAYDAKIFELENELGAIPGVIQERIYTSPIWYTP